MAVAAQKTSTRSAFGEKIDGLEAAVVDADTGNVTNARKLEALATVESLIPALPREEVARQQKRLEDLCERLLAQNATAPLRRLVVSIFSRLHLQGDPNSLSQIVERLLKLAGDQNKKIHTNTKVACLIAVGELMTLHGMKLEAFSTDIFVVVAKHMKFPEATGRASAFQCLCKTIVVAGFRNVSVANNIWKMVQKMVPDKALSVRTAAAQALSALVEASPECAFANGESMADMCKKALVASDELGSGHAAASECRFAFAVALAQVLAAMASPPALASAASAKKKPLVSDFASAVAYVEQAAAKGPSSGPVVASYRAGLCLVLVRHMKIQEVTDSASIGLLMRSLLGLLDVPAAPAKGRSGGGIPEDDPLPQLSRHIATALRHVLLLIDSEAVLLEIIEQVLVPMAGAQFNETSASGDARMIVVMETLCSACAIAGDGFRTVENKVSKPLLHLVGNHSNPMVQLHGAYCLRAVARSSPPQLFQLMSVLLNLATVQNAELLGAPGPRRNNSAAATSKPASGSGVSAELQLLLRGLFGHCAALASLVGELFHSDLGVPHDVTSAVLGTARALLQPHPNSSVTAQRRSCAFILVEGLMCLGTDWVGHRLTVLFALWKAALGKKPVERAKALYQHHLSSGPAPEGGFGVDGGVSGCRDELLSLLCALRSLYAFTVHSSDTLLTSLPHLHKILVVFLTNISQLLMALPHPTSASLRAKTPRGSGQDWPFITLATKCSIPEILLMIRSTMYHTFAAMLTTQYSSRFVSLLNMLAHDVTMPASSDFPSVEFLDHYLPPEDTVLDLVDPYSDASKDGAGTTRLSVAALLATSPVDTESWNADLVCDPFSDAAAASFFSGAPREGHNSTEAALVPWDAWLDPACTLASQCTSPEWDWRYSAIKLLATIMNSHEVSEAPRTQVLMHLLKRRDATDDSQSKRAATPATGDQTIIPSLAVLMFLREHVRASAQGAKGAPPQAATESILRMSFDGLKEPNPAIRRLHVEILSLLFYIHYELTDSSVAAGIIQHIATETLSHSETVRSAIALLCGSLLRTFAAGIDQPTLVVKRQKAPRQVHNTETRACPYLPNVVPLLLKLAKETSQPVRLWMLHAMNISMQSVGGAFAPFLKAALRLATAHLLADQIAAPVVFWVIGALVQSAASGVLAAPNAADESLREENVERILNIWSELQHTRYEEPSDGHAFATVRTEVLCISTAHSMVQLAPIALDQLKDVFDLISKKLVPNSGNQLSCSPSCAVRTAAAQCITNLVANGHSLGGTAQEPAQFFILLDGARGAEAQAIRQLICALIRQGGLSQLPMWMQTLREMILALPPKAATTGNQGAAPSAGKDEENPKDEHDDGAGLAAPTDGAGGGRSRVLRGVTKVFAVSCVHLLLEQADPEDANHFAAESAASPSAEQKLTPDQRFVTHLETLVALASNASSSDNYVLAATGLKLMLLIIQRFRHTRDLAGRPDEVIEECPLLIVQFEAQVTTCVRHNLLPQANPGAVSLALELLRRIIVERACLSPQRLITLLMQPFVSPTFEPDPSFCESNSTKRFLYRLRCACEILDTDMEEQSEQAVYNHIKDLARWIEHALRDTAVLVAGMPLQSIKTYEPLCFSLTDYKAVQPIFREILPALLRGVCALCSSKAGAHLAGDVISLSLGIISLQLTDRNTKPSIADIKIFLRTIRKVVLQSTISGSDLKADYILDLIGVVWQHVFSVPQRCCALLPDILEFLHLISAVIWQQRQKLKKQAGTASKAAWLDEFLNESVEGVQALAKVAAYCFHCIAAALRAKDVVNDAARVQQALDVFVWWFEGARMQGVNSSEEGGNSDVCVAGSSLNQDYWLWLLFMSAFPLELVNAHPAVTLKYWRTVCTIISAPLLKPGPETGAGSEDFRLSQLSAIIDMLCCSLLSVVEDATRNLNDVEERTVVYSFALLVPAVVSLCTLLREGALGLNPKRALKEDLHEDRPQEQPEALASPDEEGVEKDIDESEVEQKEATADTPDTNTIATSSGQSKTASQVVACMSRLKQVFASALQHCNAKAIQTAISSMQNLLQNPTCAVLSPVIVPCLVFALTDPDSKIPEASLEAAWCVICGMVTSLQASDTGDYQELTGATTQMMLMIIVSTLRKKGFANRLPACKPAMAQCLLQLTRANQASMKAEVAALPADSQQSIQQLLREHMSATSQGGQQSQGGAPNAAASAPAKKIELKLKF